MRSAGDIPVQQSGAAKEALQPQVQGQGRWLTSQTKAAATATNGRKANPPDSNGKQFRSRLNRRTDPTSDESKKQRRHLDNSYLLDHWRCLCCCRSLHFGSISAGIPGRCPHRSYWLLCHGEQASDRAFEGHSSQGQLITYPPKGQIRQTTGDDGHKFDCVKT